MRVVAGLLIALIGALYQASPQLEADGILTQLSKIRLDKKQIYSVRDITIRRDVLSIALNRGAIAFLEPINGKITGAVFIGSGEIVAIPPDPIEKQQIYKFTGTPILNEAFQTAIFRFSDATDEEIKREISQHAQEDVSPDDAAQFDSLESVLSGNTPALNLRLAADFLEPAGKPLFFGTLKAEKRGWFNVAFDLRATEEVSVFQLRDVANTIVPDVWASFNQRSEARNPEAVAHENKSPVEILSYDLDGTAGAENKIDAKLTMRVRARTEGARVLSFDLAPSLRIASILTDADEQVPYYQYPDASNFKVVVPPLKPGQELTLRFMYAGGLQGQGPWYPWQEQQSIPAFKSNVALPEDKALVVLDYLGHKVAPASYHDRWLVEGLMRYLGVMSVEGNDAAGSQLQKLLSDARDELKPVDDTGPIWLGPRLLSTASPNAYRAVSAKGVWVIHMLRMLLRQTGQNSDATFQAMLEEFSNTHSGKSASTWDFKRLAEKFAGKKLDWFFDQWVFATGLPSYSADYKVEASGQQFTIEGRITQTGVPDGFIMPVPVYADSDLLGVVEVGESEGQFKFRVNTKPESLRIDPEMTVLSVSAQ